MKSKRRLWVVEEWQYWSEDGHGWVPYEEACRSREIARENARMLRSGGAKARVVSYEPSR